MAVFHFRHIRLLNFRRERLRRIIRAHITRRIIFQFESRGYFRSYKKTIIWKQGLLVAGCNDIAFLKGQGSEDWIDTVLAADRILAGEIELHFQEEIPWTKGPALDGQWHEWPSIYWADINLFESGLDAKVTWELNRCQHLVILARAYRLTGNEPYAQEFVRQVESWIRSNPYERGINWRSVLDVGFRVLSWAYAADLCQGATALTNDFISQLSRSLWQHGEHLEMYLERHPQPDTHLLCEALALSVLGIGFWNTRRGEHWRIIGIEVFSKGLEVQFTQEGLYYERNLQYHAYALEFYLQMTALVRHYHLDLPARWDQCLTRMLETTAALADKDGQLPQIGDDDGGRPSALDNRINGRDVRPLFALGAALYCRPDLEILSKGYCEEAFWLLGKEGVKHYPKVPDIMPSEKSVFLPDSGYSVQRSGDRSLWMRCGSLGMGKYAGHGHADLLHLVVQTEQGCSLIDSGTFTYNGDEKWREYFRSTRAHNTIVVDSHSQSFSDQSFAWEHVPKCTNLIWHSDPVLDWVSASYVLPSGISHKRGVLFIKPFCWLIFDELTGTGTHTADLWYHFSQCLGEQAFTQKGCVQLPDMLIYFLQTPNSIRHVYGLSDPIQGWISPGYGLRKPASAVCCRQEKEFPVRFLTLLWAHLPDLPILKTVEPENQSNDAMNPLSWHIQSNDVEIYLDWTSGSKGKPGDPETKFGIKLRLVGSNGVSLDIDQ
jgi:hypothetical protein